MNFSYIHILSLFSRLKWLCITLCRLSKNRSVWLSWTHLCCDVEETCQDFIIVSDNACHVTCSYQCCQLDSIVNHFFFTITSQKCISSHIFQKCFENSSISREFALQLWMTTTVVAYLSGLTWNNSWLTNFPPMVTTLLGFSQVSTWKSALESVEQDSLKSVGREWLLESVQISLK